MAIQTINLGNYANDGTGDDLRTAFEKVNANFAQLGAGEVHDGENLGSGGNVFAGRSVDAKLQFRSLVSSDSSVAFSQTATELNLSAKTKLQSDLAPKVVAPVYAGPTLTNPLDLNRNTIVNGDSQTTVWGISVINLNTIVSIMLETNMIPIDMGSFSEPAGYVPITNPSGYDLEMGSFLIPGGTNQFNFGSLV